MESEEKIQLKATMTRQRRIKITDQHGREFNVHDPATLTRGSRTMSMELDMNLPHWSMDGPTVTVRIEVPLEIEA